MSDNAVPVSWDDCVSQLLGPKLLRDDPEVRRRNALELAAAALRAAGKHDLVSQLSIIKRCE